MTHSQVRLADALDRIDQHHALHLPLRRTDLIGRLAMKVLWRRHVKWQLETNLAVRDAVTALREVAEQQRAELARVAEHEVLRRDVADFATVAQLANELDRLRVSDQTMISGLNQRLYAAIGSLRTELGDLRMQLAEKQGEAQDADDRIAELRGEVEELVAQARDARGRGARLDLLLDRLREEPAVEQAVREFPARRASLELALYELLDGPAERVAQDRAAYLPVVRAAAPSGATVSVFDVAPGRGEWLGAARAAGVEARSASLNPLVVRRCADSGLPVTHEDPVDALAALPHRTLTAVTAFRFAERAAPEELARMVDAASQALAAGGLLIVECRADTDVDPLANRPVHPALLRFLAESAGFARVEVREPGPGPFAQWPAKLAEPVQAERFCLLAWR